MKSKPREYEEIVGNFVALVVWLGIGLSHGLAVGLAAGYAILVLVDIRSRLPFHEEPENEQELPDRGDSNSKTGE